MQTTIKDIARKLSVSHVTVSKALRGQPPISLEMQKKVQKVALEMGYRPNILARGLKGGKTQTVGLIFSLGGPHSPSELVRMIAGKIHLHHYVTQVSDSFFLTDVLQRLLRDYIRRGVDAVVIQLSPGMCIEKIEGYFRSFKAVVLIHSIPMDTTVDLILLNRQQAIRAAVDHFVDTGRKRPMILAPPRPREEKIDPFFHRLQERGFLNREEPAILHRSNPMATGLAEVAWEALETRCPDSVPFDALLCGTDEAAVAAYKWLESRGKKVPRDVAVVGFNDSTYAKFLMPALASINRQDEEVAKLVETMLFDRLENPDSPPQRAEVCMTFVPRTSAG
ncbi:MAG: LacI family DNA-binding transcriptional regulator [Phycisphaerae bacterium]|nr:LacI family DNA-binding transcriptional regulator [Phycisphaerae bacterium]